MEKIKIIQTPKAPRAIGPYSQAVKVGQFIFCSGQIALDPESGEIIAQTIQPQTKQALENLSAVLKAAGSSLDKVVKTTVFLKNINDFPEFNRIYSCYFERNKPARATIQVADLPKNALVEIEAVATS